MSAHDHSHSLHTKCRLCGCNDDVACVTVDGPCRWVLLDIYMPTGVCSSCAEIWDWDLQIMGLSGMPLASDGRR